MDDPVVGRTQCSKGAIGCEAPSNEWTVKSTDQRNTTELRNLLS